MSIYVLDILEEVLGEPRKHNEGTGQCSFDCPACSEEKGMPQGDGKGNLEINYNRGVFKCWACQDTNNMHGPVIKLLKRYGSHKNQREYLLIKPESIIGEDGEREEVDLILPEGYKKLIDCTPNDFKYNMAMNYLKQRGITEEIIKEFDIGYTFKGKFFNRIVIPSYDTSGKLNYFIARWFSKEKTTVKYLNPTEPKKTEIIFNEGKINWDATIYLVEGVYDHIVTPNSIPLLGKYITDELLDKLHEKARSYVVVLLDSDATEDAKLLYRKLNFGNLRDRVKICIPPDNYDPSRVYEKLGNQGIVKLLKKSKKISEFDLW